MRLNDKTAYMIISEYKGVRIPMVSFGCTYSEDGIVTFYERGRVRKLKVVELLKVSDSEFEFIDSNNVKVHIHSVTANDFKKYKEKKFLFLNAPSINSDEEVQNWLMKQTSHSLV